MTPSLRQFMFVSIVGMTVLLMGLLYFHLKLSNEYLKTHLDTHNRNMAVVLRNSLLEEGLGQALGGNSDHLSAAVKAQVAETLAQYLRRVPVIKVKVYSRDAVVVYSTRPEEIGESAVNNKGVQNGLLGESLSGLVERDHMNEFDQRIESHSIHQQYIPIRNSDSGEFVGVFEIYTDITDILAQVEKQQRAVFWMIGSGLILFYVALAATFLGTHRKLQRETRRRLVHLNELEQIRADLEDRVKARTEELDKSRQFLQSVIDGIGNPLMVIRPDFSVALMNAAARQSLATGDRDLPGDIYCYQTSHGQDRPCREPDHPCSFKQVMEQGITARVRHTHIDDKGLPKLIDLVTTPLYSTDGSFEGVIEVEHDITQLVNMQSGLEQSEARLQAIMDNVPDAILTCDNDCYIRSVNAAAERLFNASSGELIGCNFNEFFVDQEACQGATQLAKSGRIEGQMRRIEGENFPAEIWIGPLKQGDKSVSYIAVVRDITRRLQAQQELEATRQQFFHQEKMAAIGHLAAGILHEVGNPIAAIAGAAADLKQASSNTTAASAVDGTTMQDGIQIINEQSTRLSRITREIADFASPKPRERELLDINGLLHSTASLLSYDQRFRAIDIQLQLDSHLPAIIGVADQLTQVFMNLMLNAMDATTSNEIKSPKIVLRSGAEDTFVSVRVEDNGSGMTEETLDRALEPFFSTKPVGKGSGLGLALCESIIQAHGGKLLIASKPGQGTQVQVLLPVDIS